MRTILRQRPSRRPNQGNTLVIVDLPLDALLKASDAGRSRGMLFFNAGAVDDKLRGENCRTKIIDIAPTRSMLAGGLAQYLVRPTKNAGNSCPISVVESGQYPPFERLWEENMFRSITIATALSIILWGVASADAATYCASYVGGHERHAARSQCVFANLHACRASVRNRGGGHCYRQGQLQ
jgi:hypothetical protein